MPTNPAAFTQRCQEVSAVACCQQTLSQLHNLACAPSGKVYAREREARRALWNNIIEVAKTQALALAAPPPAARQRNRKPVTVAPNTAGNKGNYHPEPTDREDLGYPPVEPTVAKA